MERSRLNPPKQTRDRIDSWLALLAILTILVAWVVGGVLNQRQAPDCRTVLPQAEQCLPLRGGALEGVVRSGDGSEEIIGWAKTAEAQGYAGPIELLVGVSPSGETLGVEVLSHSETPAFFARLEEADFIEGLQAKPADSPFRLGDDLDTVTRATLTSRAIAEAAREASYAIAETQLDMQVSREPEPIEFGLPEIVLIALFAAGYIGHKPSFKHTRILRWVTMITGLIVLGFIYNVPLTIAHINSLLLGYFPDWHSNLYWYLLVGGVLFVVTVDNKNPYCSWFCPFGAAQECLGAIGGAKLLHPGKYRYLLQWVQRGLAWSAIVIALLLRNPGTSSYEIFGTLFAFNGVGVQWIILLIILVVSLFVRRPWCNYLCPIDPVADLVQAGHRWVRQAKRQWQKTRQAASS